MQWKWATWRDSEMSNVAVSDKAFFFLCACFIYMAVLLQLSVALWAIRRHRAKWAGLDFHYYFGKVEDELIILHSTCLQISRQASLLTLQLSHGLWLGTEAIPFLINKYSYSVKKYKTVDEKEDTSQRNNVRLTTVRHVLVKAIKMCDVLPQSQRRIPDCRFVFKRGDECISSITTGRAAEQLLLFTCCLAARPTTTAVFKIDLHLFHVYYFFLSLLLPLYLFLCISLFSSHSLPLCLFVQHPAGFFSLSCQAN